MLTGPQVFLLIRNQVIILVIIIDQLGTDHSSAIPRKKRVDNFDFARLAIELYLIKFKTCGVIHRKRFHIIAATLIFPG